MKKSVILDAMVPRDDFYTLSDSNIESENVNSFRVNDLSEETSFILPQLRKPDFQRETNNWSPEQICLFVKSFLDRELIPSVILWKSQSHLVFVIDGGHRLSALRAWITDDYGDRSISKKFYGDDISEEQLKIAEKTRTLIEKEIGSFSKLKNANKNPDSYDPLTNQRAKNLGLATIPVLWVHGDANKAETSFFKINQQGTALDPVENKLLQNRTKPIPIAARAIVRAGKGHKYWSGFNMENQKGIENQAEELNKLLFEPSPDYPLKTLDLPLAGIFSPLEALDTIMTFLSICTNESKLEALPIDDTGEDTINCLTKALKVTRRITGNSRESLGLHPAVYFYGESGKHNKYLFFATAIMIEERLRNNDSEFFHKFTRVRKRLESFLVSEKSLLNAIIVNTYSNKRESLLKEIMLHIIDNCEKNAEYIPSIEDLQRIHNFPSVQKIIVKNNLKDFSKETKSHIYLREALERGLSCNICGGLLDSKAISYDHIKEKNQGGLGYPDNGQLTHPFCNSGVKTRNKALSESL
jgi:rubrerythrin